MKIKKNYLLQITFLISSMFFYIGLCMLVLILFSDMNEKSDFIKVSLSFIFMPILFFIISSLINYLINLFVKPTLILNDDIFIYKDGKYKYSDIYKLEYNLGQISKNHGEIAELVINIKHSQKIIIKNPSIKMIRMMKKKCFNKPFKIENWQVPIIIGIIVLIITILLGIFGVE